MSPRHFWNHPLQELARSLANTLTPGDPGRLTNDEFATFLARLVGSASSPTMQPVRAGALRRDRARRASGTR